MQHMDLLTGVAIVALSAIGAALGTFVKEYFGARGRKEGEIDSIARNLDEVLRQLRETTKATEQTRAEVSAHLEHDRKLFEQYDALLTESVLRDALDGDLYAKRSTTGFTKTLHTLTTLAESDGAQFVIEPLQEAFAEFVKTARTLRTFLARHFFTLEPGAPRDAAGDFLLELYPEFKHSAPQPGKPDWEARAIELDHICEEVSDAYGVYRRAVKKHLAR